MPLFRKKNVPNVSTRAALPAPIANLLRESWWLLLVVLLGYLLLVLSSYHRGDPGWSHSATEVVIHNRGGAFGAWLADVLLYTFGVSAWWWTVFCLAAILWGYRRIDRITESSKPLVFLACIGFALIILSSASLEALRLHSLDIVLPHKPGGILGLSLGGWLMKTFGFSGATLLLITTMGLGVSLFTGLSWLNVMENIGAAFEWVYFKTIDGIHAAQDRRIGREIKKEREQKVMAAKKKQDDKAPLIITPHQSEVPVAKKLEREKKELEKQQEQQAKQAAQPMLFAEDEVPPAPAPVTKKTSATSVSLSDGSLPSLALLAPAPVAQESISKETLEFTSQLIERKLADFNVEVKVVAAYPGPVR
jgi:S-DNA-T family DNA segregation ATPase FtsK/SpoIIIE